MSDDHSPPETDLNEDAWDLADDELALGKPITPVPLAKGLSERKEPFPEKAEEDPLDDPSPVSEPLPSPVQMIPRSETQAEVVEEITFPEPPASSSPQNTTRVRSESRSSRSTSSSNPEKPPQTKSSFFEKVAIVITMVVVAGLAAGGLIAFNSEAPNSDKLVEFTSDFPVESKNAVIRSVTTWWREPVRTGENIDPGVVLGINLIPCGTITLESSKTTTLQANFRDGEGKLIGDTINLPVKDGKFVTSGSRVITFNCTGGFQNTADIHPYTLGDIDPWSLEIVDEKSTSEVILKVRVRPHFIE